MQAELNEARELRLEDVRLWSLTEACNASRKFSKTTTSLPTFTDQVHPPTMAYASTKDISDTSSSSSNGHVAQPMTYRESVH